MKEATIRMRKLLCRVVPWHLRLLLRNFEILALEYGQYKSIRKESSIDATGLPLPWYTYPAIEYVKQFDFSNKVVFEWGSGNSTLFWASRSKEVISVEHEREWFEKINRKKPANVKIILAEDKGAYTNAVSEQNMKFDVIIIDGYRPYSRYDCARLAVRFLKENGLIILDNSDWEAESCSDLRDSGFNQVDFCGFGPSNSYVWCTSLFFSRDFDFKRLVDTIRPTGGIAAQE